MNEIFTAALERQRFCERQRWRFCFIGGVAVQRWAEPRFTGGAGMTLLTGFGEESRFAGPFEENSIRPATAFDFPAGQSITTCSAEALLDHEVFGDRETDWLDVDGILSRKGKKLNIELVRTELKPLLESQDEPEKLGRLEKKIHARNLPFSTLPPPDNSSVTGQ